MSIKNVNEQLELSDIGLGLRKTAARVTYADFTDGGSTDGTYNMAKQLPAGAFVVGTKVTVETAFSGDTTAVLSVGNSSDANKYSDNTTINVASTGVVGDSPEDPLEFIATATTVKLTVTGASDFTLITAGQILVEVFYLSTVAELVDGQPGKNV
jgi:hypothetical protein